jgi:outer membrane protein OmpA-like peptidoglycan-associated protein
MKKILSLFLIILTYAVSAQNYKIPDGYKSFNDSTFSIGDKILAPEIIFSLSGGQYVLPECYDSVKIIADFLMEHPEICIEIGVHTDYRGADEFNDTISYHRAGSVKEVLVGLFEIDPTRIEIKGYGKKQPLISKEEIDAVQSKEMQETMHRINRRVEVKIIQVQ